MWVHGFIFVDVLTLVQGINRQGAALSVLGFFLPQFRLRLHPTLSHDALQMELSEIFQAVAATKGIFSPV